MKAFLVRRWWLLLLIPMVVGLFRLRLDMEVLNLLPGELPVVAGLQLYQKHLADSGELIITLEAGDAGATEAAARELGLALRSRSNLVSRVFWQAPWREHPDQLGELLGLAWLNQPPPIFAELARRLQPASVSVALGEARQALATSLSPDEIARASYDPFGLSRLPPSAADLAEFAGQDDKGFASADGRLRLIFVQPKGKLNSYRETALWLNQVRAAVQEIRLTKEFPGEVRIAFTGTPAYVAETASGMERDIKWSVAGTSFIIAGLFWWAHRRWKPLFWLLGLLLLVLAGTTALGGLIFGALNAVSLGFAAILLGLAVDYGLVLYQEARAHPEASVTEIRRAVGPGILWSALTTASAFALLNFGGLPGLAQLGTMVALGVLLAAGVMLMAFLPATLEPKLPISRVTQTTPSATKDRSIPAPGRAQSRAIALATVLLPVLVVTILYWRPPIVDHSPGALSLRRSEAESAMQSVRHLITDGSEPLWLLVAGKDEREVAGRIRQLEDLARSAEGKNTLGNLKFPTVLWPDPDHQLANRVMAIELASRQATLRQAVTEAGFREEAFALTQTVLDTWARTDPLPLWPRASANLWLLEKAAARTETGWLVSGVAQPPTNALAAMPQAARLLAEPLANGQVWLTSWTVLGETLLQFAESRLRVLVGVILALNTFCLWLAFRSVREVLFSYAALSLGFALLLALMSVFGWTWNLMNLMAVPLLLGAGADYGIHVQLALRRHRGDISAMRRTTGQALALCAATTIVAFGSLSWSSNAGLASLGYVCAAGIACVLLVCLFLLPGWWNWGVPTAGKIVSAPVTPSVFYRAGFWRCGLWLVRALPQRVTGFIARCLGRAYCRFHVQRREVVVRNLLPVCNEERPLAEVAARRMFEQFAVKLLDLWRLEAGSHEKQPPYQWSGWEHFEQAQGHGRGVLVLTAHLGNWEFGGALLAARGVKLLVLTQAEPGHGFTALRQQGRSRWGIETLVVGEDPFAFVEIIKRLQAGAVVALLVDRPPSPTAVTIELFGRPFRASIAAAELARAAGCALLPVYVVQDNGGYSAHILPEITYDRAAIGNRAARVELTQQILRAFAPAIRQHPEQWYHFVPIWP